jgi:hypothetical protein
MHRVVLPECRHLPAGILPHADFLSTPSLLPFAVLPNTA